MKTSATFMILGLLFSVAFVSVEYADENISANAVPTRGAETWTKNMNISDYSSCYFYGEYKEDHAPDCVSPAGDVNGDGFDDFLMGYPEGRGTKGITYLVLGGDKDWKINRNLSEADATFIGEYERDWSGYSVSGAGDVNDDGYDDIIIGAYGNDEGGNLAGQVYIFFGKSTGWGSDTNLSDANASIIGEKQLGMCVSGAGDVNNDGMDDLLIGSELASHDSDRDGTIHVIFGRKSGWSMDMSISTADASYYGEFSNGRAGNSLAALGDVNGDDIDDFAIGAWTSSSARGKVYLIFGKESGWGTDVKLSNADASYYGEAAQDYFGWDIDGAGDVNGDGLNDLIAGAWQNGDNGLQSGKAYLIFGKTTGWDTDEELIFADASFYGEGKSYRLGDSVGGIGDINSDGLDDVMIGSIYANNGSGKVHVIYGKQTGWFIDQNISDVEDASFIMHTSGSSFNWLGNELCGTGDVDGDGVGDVAIIATYADSESGKDSGKVFFINGHPHTEPTEVYSFDIYSDQYTTPAREFDLGSKMYLRLTGEDGDPNNTDGAMIYINFSKGMVGSIPIIIRETDKNTGIYQGEFFIPMTAKYLDTPSVSPKADLTFSIDISLDYLFRPASISSIETYPDQGMTFARDKFDIGDDVYFKVTGTDSSAVTRDKAFLRLSSELNSSFDLLVVCEETGINSGVYVGEFTIPYTMELHENITTTSLEDGSKTLTFQVNTPVIIAPFDDIMEVYEDQEYRVRYRNLGYNPVNWVIDFDASWLNWNPETHVLNGTPDNRHVGPFDVYIEIDDGKGNTDSHDFQIQVINTAPNITTEDITTILEGDTYRVDYNSTDDGQGDVTWKLFGASYWLSIDGLTGEISGTPYQSDVGIHNVSVIVDDGNGGTDKHDFQITVIDRNQDPEITSMDITTGKEGELYYRDYEVFDPDGETVFTWELTTDAEFLTIESDTGILEGTPRPADVGVFNVNVSVFDAVGMFDSHIFDLTIENINSKPEWIDVPDDQWITHGDTFYFDVNATDPDPDGFIEYSITSKPESDITIDAETGEIEWIASIHWLGETSNKIEFTIKASDGELFTNHKFTLTIEPTLSPTVGLIGPTDKTKVPSQEIILEWEGADPEDDELSYDIYIHQTSSFVDGMRDDALYLDSYEGETLTVNDLDEGKTYYWTIRPYDGCTYGNCAGGTRSFRVNFAPKLSQISAQEAVTGKEFKVRISCSDEDPEDASSLSHTLQGAPDGMTISETGTIKWTPESDQDGDYRITVAVDDGTETVTTTFDLEVLKGEESSSMGLFIGIGAGALVLIGIILLLLFLVLRKNKGEGKKEDEEEEEDEEARKIREDMEKHQAEEQWLEEHSKHPEENGNGFTSVPLSASEAHAHDHDNQDMSYEDLYGQPAPEMEEGDVTAEELKEHLQEAANEIEQMEAPVQEENVIDSEEEVI